MSKNPSLARLARAMARDHITVTRQNGVYRFARADNDHISAEVLLPEGFPIEKRAVRQLLGFASTHHPHGGRVHRALATPDFHPGDLVPVGSVVATSPDLIIPQAIGTDINCGMRLHTADIDLDTFEAHRDTFVEKVRGDLLLGSRDLPIHTNTMRALLTHGLIGWHESASANPLGALIASDFDQIEGELERVFRLGSEEGDVQWAPESLLPTDRDTFRDSYLATVGGGNHFVEIQVVDRILDGKSAWEWGVKEGQLAVMVHTGSRRRWPSDVRRPESGITPLYGEAARSYLSAMQTAANYGAVNRMLIAELVRLRLREVFGPIEAPLVFDAPHNQVFEEGGQLIHRKGATPAHEGDPVLIPGSMGHPSFLLRGLGAKKFLSSASHGAGRQLSRHEMFRKDRDGEDLGLEGVCCITLKEERRVQEAPVAYKPIQPIIDVQVEHGIVAPVARMRPLLTFKA
jgi:tRNA-splicing ligase RtcB